MTFSALDSDLTGSLFATEEMRVVFSDHARLAAMLRVEAALAEAEAAHNRVPPGLAAAIRRIQASDLDVAAIGRATARAGVPTIPFVNAVEERLPAKLRGYFHKAATSQDILDTALVLQAAEALDRIAVDLDAISTGLARLARAHRRTPCVGRTYGQHAAPVTFGYVAAVWLAGVIDVAAELPDLRRRALTASLGGPVGTLAALGDDGAAIVARFARILNLESPAVAWHVSRARVVRLGAWLATLIGALAKIAGDVVFLSATEVGEVAEAPASGRGGSSSMPHKRNPVSSTVILAAHGAAGGLLASLSGAMAAANQRPAGAWQSEWHALPQLFGLASGALREARRIADGLVVDKARMRANLDLTGGLVFSDAVAARLAPKLGRHAAGALVEAAAATVRQTGRSFGKALAADRRIRNALGDDYRVDAEMQAALAAAAAATDRVLKDAAVTRRAIATRKRRR